MSPVYIYTLSCPLTESVKYVGKTNNLSLRINQHLSDRRGMTKVKSWIKSLQNKGLKPIIEVIEQCNYGDWRFWESYWISQFKSWGYELKNIIDGGIGMGEIPEEMKIKISNTLKGRKPPKAARLATIKPVCQYSLDGVFIKQYESITETGFEVSSIISAIKRTQSAFGFQWRYYTPDYLNSISSYKRNRGKSSKRGSYKKKVIAINKSTL